ncbi:hypothetical protein KI387_030979 [Taxus chinensis]|uniref:Uncharacterized protein n=1 Tax=Taxus chinensis TaxID=29808 RepID=A0AA38CFI0_TAXCH|nr:hypothetical protein KI387_030979 [Taxus chinensis]
MISSSDNASDISSSSINDRYVSFPNMIRFQLGKRKKELLAREADENVFSNGDKTRIGGNLTPIQRKKTKLLQMSPGESLHPNENVQFYNTNTRVQDEIQLKRSDEERESSVSGEKINVGGSLEMLVDAIQVIEYQRLHTSVGLQGPGKDLISVLPENIIQGINSVERPNLQNQQVWAIGGLEAAKELPLATQPWDDEHNPKGILKAVDIDADGRAMRQTRSKEGWLPTLPSKYSDSVLQPWKKVTRKVPRY